MELGDARLRLRAAIGFEEASWRPGLPGHRAVELLTSALAGIPTDADDPLYVEGIAALSRAIAFTGAVNDAEALGNQAIDLARRLDDHGVLAAALRASISQTLRPHGLSERLGRSAELAQLTRGSGNDAFGAAAYFRSAACYIIGDRPGLDETERDLVETARQWGSYWNYWVECLRFGRLFAAGRLDDAAAASRRIRLAETGFKSDATSGVNAIQSYMVRRESGRIDAIRPLITGEESPSSRWAPGLLAIYTELEMAEPARRMLAWMLSHDEPATHESAEWPARLAFLAEAALWLGDVDVAARLRPWMAEYAGLNLMSGYFVAIFGSADRYLGEIDSLCHTGSPLEHFDAALELDERSDAPLHIAQTLAVTAAHVRRHEPGSRQAAALVERARTIAEPAGMHRVLHTLEAAVMTSVSDRPDGLTARELEVIRLLAEGSSNREIARRLVISEHTAANHVRSILNKIGAANRTQAAMYARQAGLL